MMHIGIIGEERRNMSLMNYIMQSEQDANIIIKTCEELVKTGCSFNSIIEQASEKNNIRFNSLSKTDQKRVERKVEEIYKSSRTRGEK